MKKHFFALGGVTNIKDFYKKFPTEEHFNQHVEMKYGGSTAYKQGGQTLHPGGDGTYYQGNFFDDGGTYVPEYGSAAYGLPEYNMGASFQDGGSPLYSTQGQALRNFMNTVAYGRDGNQSMYNVQFPEVGPRRYDDGGMSPDQAAMMAQQQGQPQGQQPPQGSSGFDPQQVMQMVAQMLQQGAQPEQIMQQLVQQGIPQDQAQQIIQQVMQQMQGAQAQQGAEQMMEQGAPQAMYGMGMKYGGTNKKYKVGGEYDVNESDVKKLIAQGYKIQYI
jgi:polyhydroxyalkanoate synthesis regulator phasin